MKETDIQLAICDLLSYMGHFFWRQNTTGVYDPTRKMFRSMPKYAKKGTPDIILVLNGQFIGIEVKTPKGRLSESQKAFQKGLEEVNGKYFVVTSVDDMIDILKDLKLSTESTDTSS